MTFTNDPAFVDRVAPMMIKSREAVVDYMTPLGLHHQFAALAGDAHHEDRERPAGHLLAEEVEPKTGELLGNFPQAFSHIGLINTALNLARSSGPAEERAEAAGEAPKESEPV